MTIERLVGRVHIERSENDGKPYLARLQVVENGVSVVEPFVNFDELVTLMQERRDRGLLPGHRVMPTFDPPELRDELPGGTGNDSLV